MRVNTCPTGTGATEEPAASVGLDARVSVKPVARTYNSHRIDEPDRFDQADCSVHAQRQQASAHRATPAVFHFVGKSVLLVAEIDIHDLLEHLNRFLPVTLERVAADDRAETAAVADGARIVVDLIRALLGAAGEDHDPPTVE